MLYTFTIYEAGFYLQLFVVMWMYLYAAHAVVIPKNQMHMGNIKVYTVIYSMLINCKVCCMYMDELTFNVLDRKLCHIEINSSVGTEVSDTTLFLYLLHYQCLW